MTVQCLVQKCPLLRMQETAITGASNSLLEARKQPPVGQLKEGLELPEKGEGNGGGILELQS